MIVGPSLTVLVLSASLPLRADEDVTVFRYQCGGADVEITGLNASRSGADHYRAIVLRGERSVDLDLSDEFMDAACMRNSNVKAMIVVQQYCGGAGCKDLDNYGIIGPRTLKVLLRLGDTNRKGAPRILGLRKGPRLCVLDRKRKGTLDWQA